MAKVVDVGAAVVHENSVLHAEVERLKAENTALVEKEYPQEYRDAVAENVKLKARLAKVVEGFEIALTWVPRGNEWELRTKYLAAEAGLKGGRE